MGFVAVECQHSQNRIEPKAIDDEFANLRGLKVSNRPIIRIARSLKSRIQIFNVGTATRGKGLKKRRIPIVLPTRSSTSPFINREAFSEPAWHAIIGHLQSNDVSELAPQRAAPVEFSCISGRW